MGGLRGRRVKSIPGTSGIGANVAVLAIEGGTSGVGAGTGRGPPPTSSTPETEGAVG